MREKLDALRQHVDELLIEQAGDGDAVERPIRGHDTIQVARLALFDEFLSVLRLWLYEFGN